MINNRDLTPKEQKVVDEFESARPGLGELVEKSIRSENTGLAETIEEMPLQDIKVSEGSSTNTFMYRRIGG